MADINDVVVIGGGPAGLTAALYASRAMRKTVIIEKAIPGGQIAVTDMVENYPGFPDGILGADLGQRMMDQALKYGAEWTSGEIVSVDFSQKTKIVKTDDEEIAAKTVIICGGAEPRKLEVPGEAELTGKGVSYCATCDGAFFKDQEIAVVGGGDAAIEEGLYLTRFASKVTVIHRRDELRATAILQDRAFNNPKVDFIWDTVVEEIVGNGTVDRLKLRNVRDKSSTELPVSGVFVYVGLHPNTDYFPGVLKLDAGGHISVNINMETEIPGVYAAGDIRQVSARQVVTAAGDGATAAIMADKYIEEHWEQDD
jgi:thioredoxin reductase (NADPH)